MTAPPEAGPAQPPRRYSIRALMGDLAFLAIALPALLGLAMLAWFVWTIFTPHTFQFPLAGDAQFDFASYRGSIYCVLRYPPLPPVVYGWEPIPGAPPQPPPPIRVNLLTFGRRPDIIWLGISHTIVAALLMLPAIIALIPWLWRRKRTTPCGFTVTTPSS